MRRFRPIVLLILVGLILWVAMDFWRQRNGIRSPRAKMSVREAERAAKAYLELEERERQFESTVLAPEISAAHHEDEFLRLWDSLNGSLAPWSVLKGISFSQLILPTPHRQSDLPGAVQFWSLESTPAGKTMTPEDWKSWLQTWMEAGWKLGRTSWTLVAHQPARPGIPASSLLQTSAQLENPMLSQRAMVKIQAAITWKVSPGATPEIDRVEVREGQLQLREGRLPFRLWFEDSVSEQRTVFPDPLMARDLDRDGFPEILLLGADRVWRNLPDVSGNRNFRREPWLGLPPDRIRAAVMADVNGDGLEDLVMIAGKSLNWWPGGDQRGFRADQVLQGWVADEVLKHPQVIAAGDVDGDGDLDLWVTQYKLPYQGGQFPTPWDDANDGFPSYLLINDGHGRFTDGTVAAGLSSKRFRRTYSASFLDLDLDGDLDLVNISDFAGLDVYRNDGQGHFTDVTPSLGESRHAFGMSHAVGDANGDGYPDILMLGMNSTVADRLVAQGVERAGGSIQRIREMTVGNRLYVGVPESTLLRPAPDPLSRPLARTGWTWGAAWVDFDRDTHLDLAIANGHETRPSVRDYERQFWWHDRFVAGSSPDPVAELYFRTAAGRRQSDRASYGGWQSNQLLMGMPEGNAQDLAWLMGVAVPEDCRNLLAEDLDGDGRLDLVVTTEEEWPQRRQRLIVFHNEMSVGNWVGFRWKQPPPPGTRVELKTDAQTLSQWMVAGDGYRSQGSGAVSFGLSSARPIQLTWFIPGQPSRSMAVSVSNQWVWVP